MGATPAMWEHLFLICAQGPWPQPTIPGVKDPTVPTVLAEPSRLLQEAAPVPQLGAASPPRIPALTASPVTAGL